LLCGGFLVTVDDFTGFLEDVGCDQHVESVVDASLDVLLLLVLLGADHVGELSLVEVVDENLCDFFV
jgi:hypothetical protein